MNILIRSYIEKCLKCILGDEYILLKDFFDVIRKDSADYIIFISRRCFVLYQIIAHICDWKRDNVISDKGIWTYRKQIEKADRIILADDILIWGSAIQTAGELLNSVLNPNKRYEIKRVIYCQYAENKNIVNIQAFSSRNMRECRILTNKLARSIMASGIPYTTFLYPFYGKYQKEVKQFDNDVVTFNEIEATEYKWNSYYDFKIDQRLHMMLECLCDGAGIRYYYKQQEGLLCVIPFAFLSDIRAEHMSLFYSNISECCRKSGWEEIAKEIEVSEADENDEKWQYLAMLISCLISRVIGVVEHVDKNFDENYEKDISEKSLAGVFSTQIYKCLEHLSKEDCLCFANEVTIKKYIWDLCLLKLPTEEGTGDNDACLNELFLKFSEMRQKYETSHDAKDKKIDYNILFKSYCEKYCRNVIQAALIECCDVGIITYGFGFEKAIGSIAKYGIGERSSVLFSLNYKDIIHQYFILNIEDERLNGSLNDERKKRNMSEVLQRERLSECEIKVFWSGIQNNVNNLYDHYLN